MEIRVNNIDLRDAKLFDSFSRVIFNCKIKYCCFNRKLTITSFSIVLFSIKATYLILHLKITLEKLSKRFTSLKLILLALIFVLKILSSQIFSLPTYKRFFFR